MEAYDISNNNHLLIASLTKPQMLKIADLCTITDPSHATPSRRGRLAAAENKADSKPIFLTSSTSSSASSFLSSAISSSSSANESAVESCLCELRDLLFRVRCLSFEQAPPYGVIRAALHKHLKRLTRRQKQGRHSTPTSQAKLEAKEEAKVETKSDAMEAQQHAAAGDKTSQQPHQPQNKEGQRDSSDSKDKEHDFKHTYKASAAKSTQSSGAAAVVASEKNEPSQTPPPKSPTHTPKQTPTPATPTSPAIRIPEQLPAEPQGLWDWRDDLDYAAMRRDKMRRIGEKARCVGGFVVVVLVLLWG
jgi:hypothetical protein